MIGGRYVPVPPRAGDLRGHRVGETFGEGVAVLRGNGFVVGTGVPGDGPLWTRLHRELSTEDTEMPGCERSLSRCRSRGTAFPGGWAVNQDQVYRRLASGSGMGGCPPVNHRGALMRMSRPRCVEPPHSNRPRESEDLLGREPSARLGLAFGVIDSLRCSQTRLALCGNSVKALALGTCHGQRVAGDCRQWPRTSAISSCCAASS